MAIPRNLVTHARSAQARGGVPLGPRFGTLRPITDDGGRSGTFVAIRRAAADRDGNWASATRVAWADARRARQLGAPRIGYPMEDSVADLAGLRPIPREALRALTCPIRAVYGEQSDVPDYTRQLNDLLPHATLTVVEGVGHSVLMDATPRVREIVVEFLAAQAAGPCLR